MSNEVLKRQLMTTALQAHHDHNYRFAARTLDTLNNLYTDLRDLFTTYDEPDPVSAYDLRDTSFESLTDLYAFTGGVYERTSNSFLVESLAKQKQGDLDGAWEAVMASPKDWISFAVFRLLGKSVHQEALTL